MECLRYVTVRGAADSIDSQIRLTVCGCGSQASAAAAELVLSGPEKYDTLR